MKPLVIAHRGASWELPENTIAAFERAIEMGADFVEFDVRVTRDGELVIAHNPVRLPLARLRERKPDVATLDETLATCAGRIGIAVEIKVRGIEERTFAALDTHGVDRDAVIVVSFLPEVILTTRRLRPGFRTVQHVWRVSMRRAATYAWAAGFDNALATPRRLARAQALGLATTVYTVNESARMRELAALGVDGLFTDRPDVLRDVLDA